MSQIEHWPPLEGRGLQYIQPPEHLPSPSPPRSVLVTDLLFPTTANVVRVTCKAWGAFHHVVSHGVREELLDAVRGQMQRGGRRAESCGHGIWQSMREAWLASVNASGYSEAGGELRPQRWTVVREAGLASASGRPGRGRRARLAHVQSDIVRMLEVEEQADV